MSGLGSDRARAVFGLALAGGLMAVAGCGDDGGGGAGPTGDVADTGGNDVLPEIEEIEYPAVGLEAHFDLAASTEDFFAFPWPSDLRMVDGHLDLSGFPVERAVGTLLEDFMALAEAEVRGFSNVTAVYFTFPDALDPETLPADAPAAAAGDASVYLLDIDRDSPWYGRRHPAQVLFRAEGGVYWSTNTLVVQPLYGFPLRNGNTYAAVVTTDVLADDGLPAIGPQAWRDVLDGSDAELAAAYEPLFQTLAELGVHRNTIAVATVFTTSAPALEMRQLRSWIHETLPQPEIEDVVLLSNADLYDLYEGTFAFEEFQDGTSPFRRFGEGTVTIDDETGEPQTRTPVDVRFALSVPSGEMPEGGWPVVLYHHGTGGDYLSFTRSSGAPDLARRGIAMLGIDQPLHGTRNPTDDDPLDLITGLAVSNLIAGAGMLVQGVADLMQATRLLRAGLLIPAEISATGEEIRTDPTRIAYIGHSQGAQTGALFLAVEDDIVSGVLSEGGGGAAISAILRKDNDIDIEQVIELALGIDGDTEPLTTYHPVLGCIAQPLFDFADPLSYARHIVLEPLGETTHDFLMTIGYQDKATPPPGIEALASTAGIPIAEPVQQAIETMALQGIGSVALPATGNLPERNGRRGTGALIQFPGRNHYLVSQDVGAQHQVYEFVSTALNGEAWVVPATDR